MTTSVAAMDEPGRPPRDGEIPVIGVSHLRDRSASTRVAAEIGRACRNTGFFYIKGHGVSDDLLARMRRAMEGFFALPLDARQAVSIRHSPHNRGYVPLEEEKLDPSRKGDLKEGFNVGLEMTSDDPELRSGVSFRGPNLWPAGQREFRATMLEYFGAMAALGGDLHRAFALDLGLPEDFFADKIDRPLAILRLLHYPPHPGTFMSDQYGAAPHTDYGNVTILWQDDAGGLEVRARSGEWIAALPVAGTFVCNIGDCLMRWSNDTYISTPHRVVNRSGRERWSVPFFFDPNPETAVECLPTCSGPGRPARYKPTTGAAYLKERLDATYAFRRTD